MVQQAERRSNQHRQDTDEADAKGLESKHWDTPAWPISFRDRIWDKLMENGVGVLNVDDLVSVDAQLAQKNRSFWRSQIGRIL